MYVALRLKECPVDHHVDVSDYASPLCKQMWRAVRSTLQYAKRDAYGKVIHCFIYDYTKREILVCSPTSTIGEYCVQLNGGIASTSVRGYVRLNRG